MIDFHRFHVALMKVAIRETFYKLFIYLVLALREDPVPNIRFNVAKTLEVLLPKLEKEIIENQVKQCLMVLASDTDNDVKYFAKRAMKNI